MPRDPGVLLEDMLDAITRISDYTNGFQAATMDDPRTLDAVLRNLEVMGEAAKNMPDAQRAKMPDIEWRKIAGFRDVLAHQYFGVDRSVLDDVVANKLPGMLRVLRAREDA